MSEMEQFFTREKANAGTKIPLRRPDGTETEHYLVIRGIDSDAFRDADLKSKRAAVEIAALTDQDEQERRRKEVKLDLVSALIADWSFAEECTPENVKTLLREAPQIADSVDRLAGQRALFFGGGLSSSSNSRKASSRSTRRPKAQKQH